MLVTLLKQLLPLSLLEVSYSVFDIYLLSITSLLYLAPPSPPVSLTVGFNSPTCSGTVQLAWTPGASDRDIEMYFLSLNGVILASLGDTEYTYSVVAMSCAGNSTQTAATSISIGS